jgi:hypothetical protein
MALSKIDVANMLTGATPVANGGTALTSGFSNGITEVDQFRLTTSLENPNNADITANLERVDDASFSKVGTGMTESSGVYTFPSTGLYMISVVSLIHVPNGNDGSCGVQTYISSNSGSAYDLVAETDGGNNAGGQTFLTVTSQAFVNVTNASNFRCKFQTASMAASTVRGATNGNITTFSFVRLAGSQ